jgi:leucyl-tRNA synthetase
MHSAATTPHLRPLPPHRTSTGKLAALCDQAPGGVFLMAATLRPETMYGQTNCWALPEGRYGAYRGLEGEVFIMSERSALNLSFQVCVCVCSSARGFFVRV